MEKLERRIVWGVVAGVVVYACIAVLTDVRAVAKHLSEAPLTVMAAALGLSLGNYGLRFVKWHTYLQRLDVRIGWAPSLNVFLAGMVMSVTPGKLGEVLKSLLLKRRYDLPVARTAPVVFAERMTDLLGLFVIASVGIMTFDYGRVAFVVSLGGVLAVIGLLNQPNLVGALIDWSQTLPVVGKLHDNLSRAYESTRTLLEWKLLGWTTLISVVGWSLEAYAFYLVLGALGAQQVTVELAAFVFAMTTILGAVSLLPGGLGVTEGSMIGGLVFLEVFTDEATAAAATYLIRLATLWFGVLIGLGALGWSRLGSQSARPGHDG